MTNSIEEIKNKAEGLRLIAITCIQEESIFRLLYHFAGDSNVIEYAVEVPVDDPVLKTISDEYPSAVNYEMEAHEMYGINFEGNPKVGKRRFLPEDLHSKHPMKKNAR